MNLRGGPGSYGDGATKDSEGGLFAGRRRSITGSKMALGKNSVANFQRTSGESVARPVAKVSSEAKGH